MSTTDRENVVIGGTGDGGVVVDNRTTGRTVIVKPPQGNPKRTNFTDDGMGLSL